MSDVKQSFFNNFSNKFLERLLIFSTVNSAALCLIFILSLIFVEVPLFLLTHILFSVVFEFLFVTTLQIFLKKNSGFGFHIRLVVLFGLLAFGISFIFQEYLVPQIILVFVVVQYIFTELLFEAYLSHDHFENLCEGKHGSDLASTLHHDRYCAEDFVKNVSSVKSILFALCLILIFAIYFIYIRVGKVTFPIYLFCILTILFCFANVQLFNVYENEIYYAFLGFEKIFDARWLVYIGGILFVSACFIVSQVFSSNYAMIKFSWLIWLWNLFKKEPKPHTPQQPNVPVSNFEDFPSDSEFGKFLFQEDTTPQFMEMIIRILQYVLVIGAVVALIYYLIRPIVTKQVSDEIKKANILSVLKKFFKDLQEMFLKLFGFKIELQPYASVSSRDFKLHISDFIQRSGKSKDKKLELDRLTKEFIKVINWGEKNNVHYRKSFAPAEYCELLNEKYYKDEFYTIGLIFEKALYSAVLISKEEEKLYKACIQKICQEESK